MNNTNRRVVAAGLFFANTVLLIAYLLAMRWHVHLPLALFWVAVILMIGTLVYQILKIRLSSGHTKLVLLEIAAICLVFHLIYQIPYYGIVGSDAYADMASAKSILFNGSILSDPLFTNDTSYFPMIHILGAQLSLVTDIDLFAVVKWFPSLLSIAIVPLLYLLVRNIFKEEKVALLSVLMFACLQHHILFSSLFIRETIALIFMVFCLLLTFSARYSKHSALYYTLAILCLGATVIAHHLTSFMLAVFLLIHFLVTKASDQSSMRKAYFGDNITGERVPGSLIFLAFVGPLVYWTFAVQFPLHDLASLIKDIFAPEMYGTNTMAETQEISRTSIQTTSGYLIFYGFYFFILAFGGILIYRLTIARKNNWQIEIYSFTLFLFLIGLIGLGSLYLVPARAYPDRFLAFGWLFGFPPLVLAILQFKRESFRICGTLLLISFMALNIFMIDHTAWDAGFEGVPPAPSKEDYVLAERFDFSTKELLGAEHLVGAHRMNWMAIYDVHDADREQYLNIFGSTNSHLAECAWVIVNKEALRLEQKWNPEPRTSTIAEMEQLVSQGSNDINKIFESNNLAVFKPIYQDNGR